MTTVIIKKRVYKPTKPKFKLLKKIDYDFSDKFLFKKNKYFNFKLLAYNYFFGYRFKKNKTDYFKSIKTSKKISFFFWNEQNCPQLKKKLFLKKNLKRNILFFLFSSKKINALKFFKKEYINFLFKAFIISLQKKYKTVKITNFILKNPLYYLKIKSFFKNLMEKKEMLNEKSALSMDQFFNIFHKKIIYNYFLKIKKKSKRRKKKTLFLDNGIFELLKSSKNKNKYDFGIRRKLSYELESFIRKLVASRSILFSKKRKNFIVKKFYYSSYTIIKKKMIYLNNEFKNFNKKITIIDIFKDVFLDFATLHFGKSARIAKNFKQYKETVANRRLKSYFYNNIKNSIYIKRFFIFLYKTKKMPPLSFEINKTIKRSNYMKFVLNVRYKRYLNILNYINILNKNEIFFEENKKNNKNFSIYKNYIKQLNIYKHKKYKNRKKFNSYLKKYYKRRTKSKSKLIGLSTYKLKLYFRKTFNIYFGFIKKKKLNKYISLSEKKRNSYRNIKFLKILESRLDIILFRLGLFKSFGEIHQFIFHKNVLVNGKIINCSSFRLKNNDFFQIKESSIINLLFKNLKLAENNLLPTKQLPEYILFDFLTFSGIFLETLITEDAVKLNLNNFTKYQINKTNFVRYLKY